MTDQKRLDQKEITNVSENLESFTASEKNAITEEEKDRIRQYNRDYYHKRKNPLERIFE